MLTRFCLDARTKLAEPPPPKGVSVKEWDRILQQGPHPSAETAATLDGQKPMNKSASAAERVRGILQKEAFDQLTSHSHAFSADDDVAGIKFNAATDEELLKTAAHLNRLHDQECTSTLGDLMRVYESLGGTYKHAFGQQMFDSKQMSGSPAVSGGMSARASTPTPQIQQSPVSVTTTTLGQSGGQQGGTSAPSQTSAPSSPTG